MIPLLGASHILCPKYVIMWVIVRLGDVASFTSYIYPEPQLDMCLEII